MLFNYSSEDKRYDRASATLLQVSLSLATAAMLHFAALCTLKIITRRLFSWHILTLIDGRDFFREESIRIRGKRSTTNPKYGLRLCRVCCSRNTVGNIVSDTLHLLLLSEMSIHARLYPWNRCIHTYVILQAIVSMHLFVASHLVVAPVPHTPTREKRNSCGKWCENSDGKVRKFWYDINQ